MKAGLSQSGSSSRPALDAELLALRRLGKRKLVLDFSALVAGDQSNTARMLAYIGEIDRRRLYLEQAYPSMFAFCTKRFRMSEAIAAKRIRAGRTACRFPCILEMIRRGELHLSAIHQLAGHLTEENHRKLLRRAKYRSMREIEELLAEVSPRVDAPSVVRALPGQRGEVQAQADNKMGRATPLSPRRYRLQVTIGQEARDALAELQNLLSHQIPNGDPALVIERALKSLLEEAKKKKAALTDKPRPKPGIGTKTRAIPAAVRREVFERDGGRCTFVTAEGVRCDSAWQLEFHHRVPYGKHGSHTVENIELRCRAHNQYEAEKEYGSRFMEKRRRDS